ncbi:COG4223 family protein [Litoreibacter roseus]|uniref:Inner membrane protein n=1 Tax=Litoreibacter roseus TaxID=2601869 RepID=A0A6N6JF69_9RHOB|nr:hypothetical protein [Litoreibacter roseus]GFE64795.1 hypothetical protein KIN_18690 [Litoreibacter roseus]
MATSKKTKSSKASSKTSDVEAPPEASAEPVKPLENAKVEDAEVISETTSDVDTPEPESASVPEVAREISAQDATTPDEVILLGDADAKENAPRTDESAEPTTSDKQTDEPERAAEATAIVPPVVKTEPSSKGGGFFPMLIGGAVAAVLGFIAAQMYPDGWPLDLGGDTEALEQQIAAQQTTIEDLRADLESQTASISDLSSALTETGEARAALDARLSEIETQYDALTQAGGNLEGISAELRAVLLEQRREIDRVQNELNEMTAFAQGQIAEAEQEQVQAERARARAEARSGLVEVRNALASGDSFADALPKIAPAVEVPEALQSVASTGVATQQSLQNTFPDVARSALSASIRETSGDAPTDRFRLFLQDQLGARSLTPKEGDDPDAVLSRAEAAVKAGDLAAALKTIDALPDGGRSSLSDWAQRAQARVDAVSAMNSLDDALSAD